MPRRPRNHVLETLSEQAFARVVPPEWVVRPVQQDYGVDREVEIFGGGDATGLTFKVQLKSSERTAVAGPSRRVRTDTVGYWKSLDVPVLIAYFAADTGLLYGRWAHTVGREPGFDRDAKTTTVAYSQEEVLTAGAVAGRLLGEVELLRDLRAGRLPRPLPLRLAVDDGVVGGLSGARVAVRMRQAIRERGLDGDVRLVGPQEAGPAVLVSVSAVGRGGVLRVALPSDLASLRVTFGEGGYSGADVAGRLADDVFTAVAFMAERTGATGSAGRLLAVSAVASSLALEPDVVFAAASVMAHEDLPLPAARLAARCWASDDPVVVGLGDVYYMAVRRVGDLSAADQDGFVAAMRRRAEQDAARDPGRAGPTHYNLAKCLNALGRAAEALAAMDAVLALDRRYVRRDYFFRERGGILWTVGRYADAAADYRAALVLGADPGELVPLLADTLMHAGEYAAAGDVLAGWEPTGHDLDRMAVVLRTVVDEVRTTTGLDRQDRSAAPLDDVEALDRDPGALVGLLRAADALDPRIWLRLAVDGRPVPRLVVAAHVALNNAAGWALACVEALAGPEPADPTLVEALVASGHDLSDSPFDEAVEAVLADSPDPEGADATRTEVYRLIDELAAEPSPTVFRFLDDDDDDDDDDDEDEEDDAADGAGGTSEVGAG